MGHTVLLQPTPQRTVIGRALLLGRAGWRQALRMVRVAWLLITLLIEFARAAGSDCQFLQRSLIYPLLVCVLPLRSDGGLKIYVGDSDFWPWPGGLEIALVEGRPRAASRASQHSPVRSD